MSSWSDSAQNLKLSGVHSKNLILQKEIFCYIFAKTTSKDPNLIKYWYKKWENSFSVQTEHVIDFTENAKNFEQSILIPKNVFEIF